MNLHKKNRSLSKCIGILLFSFCRLRTQSKARADFTACSIVFVHGLQGHPKRTWTKHIGYESSRSEQTGTYKRGWRQRMGIRPKEGAGNESIEKRSSEVFWPADLLPRDCPNARILTFGYDSAVANFFGDAVSQNNVSAHAKDLLFALTRHRKTCVSPIAHRLICHALSHGFVFSEITSLAAISTSDTRCTLTWWYVSRIFVSILYISMS